MSETNSPREGVPSEGDFGRMSTFAGRLDYLFYRVHPRHQRPFSMDHVAEAVTQAGVEISSNYIWMLRSGRRDNPSLRHMEGLARFFGVPTAFLSDPIEAERIAGQLDKLGVIADSDLQFVAMRAATLNEKTLDTINTLLDQVKDLAGGLRGDAGAKEEPR